MYRILSRFHPMQQTSMVSPSMTRTTRTEIGGLGARSLGRDRVGNRPRMAPKRRAPATRRRKGALSDVLWIVLTPGSMAAIYHAGAYCSIFRGSKSCPGQAGRCVDRPQESCRYYLDATGKGCIFIQGKQ